MSTFEHKTLIEGDGQGRYRWVCACSDFGAWVRTVRVVGFNARDHRFHAERAEFIAEEVRTILIEEGSICEHTGDDGPTINVDVESVTAIIAKRLARRWDKA